MENTHTITTPISGQEVVLKDWLTGRDQRAIKAPYLAAASINSKSGEGSDVTGIVQQQAEDAAFRAAVVSIGGSADNIVDRILDMHSQDYEFVFNEVNKVTDPVPAEKKSDSPDNT